MFCSAKFQKATILLAVSFFLKLMSVLLCGWTENNIYTGKKKQSSIFHQSIVSMKETSTKLNINFNCAVIKITFLHAFCFLRQLSRESSFSGVIQAQGKQSSKEIYAFVLADILANNIPDEISRGCFQCNTMTNLLHVFTPSLS